MPTATHTRRAHSRNGRPVKAATVHHTPGQATRAWDEARKGSARQAFRRAAYTCAVAGGLAVMYTASSAFSLTAAAGFGITTWALGMIAGHRVTRRRKPNRRRPAAVSRRRKSALRRHKAVRRMGQVRRAYRRRRVHPARAAWSGLRRGGRALGGWIRARMTVKA